MNEKIIEMGLAEEILQLHKQGYSGKGIREELLKTHTDVPSESAIYKFLSTQEEKDATKPKNYDIGLHYDVIFKDFMTEYNTFTKRCLANCQNDKRREMTMDISRMRSIFDEFYSVYYTKAENNFQRMLKWCNGLCYDCKKIALELLTK
jgi:hypothetical protein